MDQKNKKEQTQGNANGQKIEINWYPGHMAKAKRLLSDQISKCDLIIELCDARLPYSSRNPELMKMTAGKKHILFLNKADLADPAVTEQWLRYFRQQGIRAWQTTSNNSRVKETTRMINDATADIVQKYADRGVRKGMKAMVIGVPNVGKSTYINHLHGSGIAATGDKPGVTKSNQWVKIGPYLELLDTPGLLWPRLDDQLAARRLCYIGSVKDDVVDLPMLAIRLLQDIAEVRPDSLCERFHLEDPQLKGVDLLDAVCKGRGFLLKGGVSDYDRCCAVVLDEFRAGKLGRITLESVHD